MGQIKLTDGEMKTQSELQAKLRQGEDELKNAYRKFESAVKSAVADYNTALEDYGGICEEVNSFRDEVAKRLRGELDAKKNPNPSDEEFVGKWEEEDQFEEPDDLDMEVEEFNDPDYSTVLEQLPVEPE